jgi:hypothetical protein
MVLAILEGCWVPRYNMTWEETRDWVMKRLQSVLYANIVSVKDFFTDSNNIYMAHEMIAKLDGATVTSSQFSSTYLVAP